MKLRPPIAPLVDFPNVPPTKIEKVVRQLTRQNLKKIVHSKPAHDAGGTDDDELVHQMVKEVQNK
ncbi:Hypothetical protein FKW44_022898 [Caligus rogercresseyi]|uniref:Uncharacterized protein n=1 Tax=Caligus rogercresseyi TaxID=217165 RepID=A0A7T8GN48_CALRO|nr:Hypothetical protein FKW44_022898 [Caligus rogercresseyi]